MKITLTVELDDGVEGEVEITGESAETLRDSVNGAIFKETMSKATGYDVIAVDVERD